MAFYSKKLLPSEKNYATVERECLAIVRGIEYFQVYLTGANFVVETDHACLQYLASVKNSKGRLTRWALKLQEYDFTVKHCPGSKNGNADGLSRQAWVDNSEPDAPSTSQMLQEKVDERDEEELYFTPEEGGEECWDPKDPPNSVPEQ